MSLEESGADIDQRVLRVVARALARDESEVRLDSVLMAELGAESLDLLDIVFQLEQEFGIQITRGAIEAGARGDLSEEEFAPGGVVSEAGLARLAAVMPYARAHIKPGLRRAHIPSLFTPETFAGIVKAKRAESAA
ncbi:MAG: acyl carrier protein [Deltaproteobacteria bacterium]|nr:acyl carrier protein [Deltaproteobacteria bacterium]